MRAMQRRKNARRLWLVLLGSTLIFLLAPPVLAVEYGNVASFSDLGMGARPLAMGEAFVSIADDANAPFYNPAGLAWNNGGFSILSSCEVRPSTSTYGHVSAVFGNFGLGVHYFDFGEIPETDEFGSTIGTFSYRSYLILAGAGISGDDLPFISSFKLSESLGCGLSVKMHRVDTLESGDGSGLSIDVPFLLRIDDPPFGEPYVTCFSFGVRLQDVLGTPMTYESGHEEAWVAKVVMGSSIEFADRITLATDVSSDGGIRFGLDWRPVTALSVQCGLKRQGVWMWSFGMGTNIKNLSVNLATVIHPVLHNQIRGSFTAKW